MNPFAKAYLEQLETLYAGIASDLAGLPPAALDWVPGPEMNSLAVLVAHTAGSVRYWIGDVGLQEDSKRDRTAEFRVRGLEAGALQARLDASLAYAREALARLPEGTLGQERAPGGRTEPVTVVWALLHALEHLATHAGHIQLTRQLWEQRSETA